VSYLLPESCILTSWPLASTTAVETNANASEGPASRSTTSSRSTLRSSTISGELPCGHEIVTQEGTDSSDRLNISLDNQQPCYSPEFDNFFSYDLTLRSSAGKDSDGFTGSASYTTTRSHSAVRSSTTSTRKLLRRRERYKMLKCSQAQYLTPLLVAQPSEVQQVRLVSCVAIMSWQEMLLTYP
jgi:hypothetical protein